MKVTHAPYAIINDLVITYGATTKTACGVRRKTETLVSRNDATCEACRSAIAADHAAYEDLRLAAVRIASDGHDDSIPHGDY